LLVVPAQNSAFAYKVARAQTETLRFQARALFPA
jgi:hypothetical protein